MKKRILAALLSISMVVALVSSCGDKDTTSTSTGTSVSTSTAAPDDGVDEVERITEITLPISDELIEFTEWRIWQNDYMTNYGEITGTHKIEELTNVHIEYTCVPTAAGQEKYGLLLASGEYPDMIGITDPAGYNDYPGGEDTAVSDGVYRDMTDAVYNYMPNYYAFLREYPDAKQMAISDEGRNVGIYMVRCYVDGQNQEVVPMAEPPWTGMSIRQDWLDELDLEVPRTIDQLHEVLVAFRDNYGAWMHLFKDGTIGDVSYILSAYGVTADFYLKEDGKTVAFGPISDGYKQYVTLMRDWYAEGLIDPDFITTESTAILTANQYFANNYCGVGVSYQGTTGRALVNNGQTNEEDFWLTPIQGPVLNEGDETVTTYQSNIVSHPTYVTSTVTDEELPLLAQWLDWHYTYDYSVIQSYGYEGVSFTIDEDSKWYYVYTDEIKNPKTAGMTTGAVRGLHALFNNVGYMNWQASFELSELTGNTWSAESYDVWGQQSDKIMLPLNASLTSEEGNEYNDLYIDIETYVQENTVQFIMGTLDIDSNWDTFVSTIEGMNVARCVELKQASLDRYYSKTWVLEDK